MTTDRQAKARECVAADIRDAAAHIECALSLMSATRWAPADRDRLTTAIRVACGAVGAARVLVDELTAATPEQDGEQAEGGR